MTTTTLVVGASVAGTRTSVDLRRNGYAGSIVLVDAQVDVPYDRPPLSKAMLTGTSDSFTPLLTAETAESHGIELRLGARAERLDTERSTVLFADGNEVRYDHLVVATGASARPTPWPSHRRILELRTLADGRALRQALRTSHTVLIVGAGFIGAEVASAAKHLGLDVTMVDPLPIPMGRLFGDEIGALLSQLHVDHGVSTHFGVGVAGMEADDDKVIVTLTNEMVLAADLVVVGIGVSPNVDWLASSGLALENGVVCDSHCRAVGHRNIYAAGDVARWLHPRHGAYARVEHWTNAVEQGQYVARSIAEVDRAAAYEPVEYAWSDQYDWKIQVTGSPVSGVDRMLIADANPERFCALWSDPAGIVVGAFTINWPKASVLTRRAIAGGSPATAVLDAIET